MKICIVIANYYPKISQDLLKGATKILIQSNIKNFNKITTQGVFEIPVIVAKNMKKYDAFIALACVIKGKTPHFRFISSAAIDALMKLSIINKKPIGNGIITCLNKKQASIRSSANRKNKGEEAAKAVLSVLGILKNDSK